MQQDGDEAYYDGTPLEHIHTYPDEFMDIWIRYEERLQHEVRFLTMKASSCWTTYSKTCRISPRERRS